MSKEFEYLLGELMIDKDSTDEVTIYLLRRAREFNERWEAVEKKDRMTFTYRCLNVVLTLLQERQAEIRLGGDE
jgi:hypothetical protein